LANFIIILCEYIIDIIITYEHVIFSDSNWTKFDQNY